MCVYVCVYTHVCVYTPIRVCYVYVIYSSSICQNAL